MLNLDSMSQGELRTMFLDISEHPRKEAKYLHLSVKDAKHYKNYSMNKIVAIDARMAGNIQIAQKYETICENIYNQMSDSAKW